jgi:hypothetical protein
MLLVDALGTERVDVVDVGRGSGVLRFHVAQEGQAVWECTPRRFLQYCERVAFDWCDMEPVLTRAYAAFWEARR